MARNLLSQAAKNMQTATAQAYSRHKICKLHTHRSRARVLEVPSTISRQMLWFQRLYQCDAKHIQSSSFPGVRPDQFSRPRWPTGSLPYGGAGKNQVSQVWVQPGRGISSRRHGVVVNGAFVFDFTIHRGQYVAPSRKAPIRRLHLPDPRALRAPFLWLSLPIVHLMLARIELTQACTKYTNFV